MGVYYNITNQTKKQSINPGKVGGGSIKQGMIFNCGTLLAWLMMTEWAGDLVTINLDLSEGLYFGARGGGYEDVTEAVVGRFNLRWAGTGMMKEPLQYREED